MTIPTIDPSPATRGSASSWPEDLGSLRRLDRAQLEALAEDIRTFLVDAVSRTGGHLGSNLGVVELTLAVHRAFDSPSDVILWDTGHQAYVHKLLTGRWRAFGSLRQAEGLSGYPNRVESEHDWVENSHASTALSYAFGMATALEAGQQPGTVVAVVGDGALTGGLAFEGLNNIGFHRRRVVVVVNDNGRSYAPTCSQLVHGGLGPFVESLGLRYLGQVDGHDTLAVEDRLRQAASLEGPSVVHALTRKGHGYRPAEIEPEKRLHDVAPFDVVTGRPIKAPSPSYTTAFGEALVEVAAHDRRVVAITAAMPGSTGLLPFAARYPSRFIDVGIAEQHAITSAAGMAMLGMRPVVAIYSAFLTRAFDQVLYDVALHRQPVVLCVDRAGITGEDGPSHHGLFDMALLMKVPGLELLAPSSPGELADMLRYAVGRDAGPTAIRWSKASPAPSWSHAPVPGCRARLLRAGDGAVCLVAVGRLVAAAMDAAAQLSVEGVDATVWDVRAVRPVDPALLLDAGRHRLVVTVEDGTLVGGLGSQVASLLSEGRPFGAGPAMVRLGVPDRFVPHGHPDQLLGQLGLDGVGITRTVLAHRAASTGTPT